MYERSSHGGGSAGGAWMNHAKISLSIGPKNARTASMCAASGRRLSRGLQMDVTVFDVVLGRDGGSFFHMIP